MYRYHKKNYDLTQTTEIIALAKTVRDHLTEKQSGLVQILSRFSGGMPPVQRKFAVAILNQLIDTLEDNQSKPLPEALTLFYQLAIARDDSILLQVPGITDLFRAIYRASGFDISKEAPGPRVNNYLY